MWTTFREALSASINTDLPSEFIEDLIFIYSSVPEQFWDEAYQHIVKDWSSLAVFSFP